MSSKKKTAELTVEEVRQALVDQGLNPMDPNMKIKIAGPVIDSVKGIISRAISVYDLTTGRLILFTVVKRLPEGGPPHEVSPRKISNN